MFISPAKALRHVDRLAAWKAGAKASPVTVEWDLSNRCVLGCQDCHFAHTHSRGPWAGKPRTLPMAFDGTGDLAETALVLRTLPQLKEAGVHGIVWSGGGEPTTHPQFALIVERAGALGLQQGMYTLGGLITADLAAVLARHLSWVVVSLDAADAQTYAADKGVSATRFAAACDGITHLAGVPVVGVSYLLTAANWRSMPAMVDLSRSLGGTYTTFRPAIQTSPDRPSVCTADRSWITDAEPLLRAMAEEPDVEVDPDRFLQYRDWTSHGYSACHGIKLATVITPDGRVWVCPQRRGVAGAEIGDLRTESFSALWSRHPGQWTEFSGCRVMCRLHLVNEQLLPVFTQSAHDAFV